MRRSLPVNSRKRCAIQAAYKIKLAAPHLPPQSDTCHCNTTNKLFGSYKVFFAATGDVHIGIVDRGGQLEVEVNQARGLTPKPGSKNIPGMEKSPSLLPVP